MDNHRKTPMAGFKYIDRLLVDALVGVTAGGDGTVFSLTMHDSTRSGECC